jgi:hypothetical protein
VKFSNTLTFDIGVVSAIKLVKVSLSPAIGDMSDIEELVIVKVDKADKFEFK